MVWMTWTGSVDRAVVDTGHGVVVGVRGTPIEVTEAQAEYLKQSPRWKQAEAPEQAEEGLAAMTIAELQALAQERGVEVPSGPKAAIVEALEAAEAAQEGGTG